jgi:squalene-associated FAD-dependent desaturase
MSRTVHIIGAGLAGLSAAVRLASSDRRVVVHEATAFAGGRCRSYHDASVGMTIDNGNHLLLSGNHAALDFLRTIGSERRLIGPSVAEFPFLDLKTRARWTLRFDDGRLPLWIFDPSRRVPGTRALDYLSMARLLWARSEKTVGDTIACKGALYSGLIEPLLLAALNIDPPQGSAKLAAAVIRETLAAGGRACRPLIARDGLAPTLIEPALEYLRGRGAQIRLEQQLRSIRFEGGRVAALDFGDENVTVADADAVILAVPPYAAAALVPDLIVPNDFRAIVNAHFRFEPPAGQPPILGVVNGATQWIFAFPGRLAVTVSAGDALLETPREQLARTIWTEVAQAARLPSEAAAVLPPWQIVRERRATFAATPAQDKRRAGAHTAWRNLALAGDWTNTGLPATIEGAIRSGNRAAQFVSNNETER